MCHRFLDEGLISELTAISHQQVNDDNEPPTYQEATAGKVFI